MKISEMYKTFDMYSYNEIIDQKSFWTVLTRDLKIRIGVIDLEFVWQIYRDKRDKRSVRYSSLIDDLKHKFELTETYVVPGLVRKDPNFTSAYNIDRNLSMKDLENQKRADKDGVKAILRHLRVQAHDNGINLEKEFKS